MYWCNRVFSYEAVSQGKLPFRYEDLKALLDNKNFIVTLGIIIGNIVIFSQLLGTMRWLSKNSDSIFSILTNAITYLFMLMVGYALVLA